MLQITKQRLLELGFKNNSWIPEFKKGNVTVEFLKNETRVFVIIDGADTNDLFSVQAEGVKTEEDLIELCRLINDEE